METPIEIFFIEIFFLYLGEYKIYLNEIFLFNYFNMKLKPEVRTKLFKIVRNLLKNTEKIIVISSDHPNKALIYMDDDYVLSLYTNLFGMGVTSNNVMLISLHERKTNFYIKFDSGDYMIMKNRREFEDFVQEINETVFDKDTTDRNSINEL